MPSWAVTQAPPHPTFLTAPPLPFGSGGFFLGAIRVQLTCLQSKELLMSTCPHCKSDRVQLRHKGRKAGSTVGGLAGAVGGIASAMSGLQSGPTYGPNGGTLGAMLGALAGVLVGGIVGGGVGSALGGKAGDALDEGLFDQYECTSCGRTFTP